MSTRNLKAIFTAISVVFLINNQASAQTFNVDSVLNSMTFEEMVGQLFMVAAYSNKDEAHFAELEKLVSDYHIGGVIVMQGGPERQKKLLDRLQGAAKVPLLVGQDAEPLLALVVKSWLVLKTARLSSFEESHIFLTSQLKGKNP